MLARDAAHSQTCVIPSPPMQAPGNTTIGLISRGNISKWTPLAIINGHKPIKLSINAYTVHTTFFPGLFFLIWYMRMCRSATRTRQYKQSHVAYTANNQPVIYWNRRAGDIVLYARSQPASEAVKMGSKRKARFCDQWHNFCHVYTRRQHRFEFICFNCVTISFLPCKYLISIKKLLELWLYSNFFIIIIKGRAPEVKNQISCNVFTFDMNIWFWSRCCPITCS